MSDMIVHFTTPSPNTPWLWRQLRPRFSHCSLESDGLVLNFTRKNGVELYAAAVYRRHNQTTQIGLPALRGRPNLFDWEDANRHKSFSCLGSALAYLRLCRPESVRNCVALTWLILRETGLTLPPCRTPDELYASLTT